MKIFVVLFIFAVLLISSTSTAQTSVPSGTTVTIPFSGNVSVRGLVSVTDSTRIDNNAYVRGRASVICPPSGFSQLYVDSVALANYTRGVNMPFDSLSVIRPNGAVDRFKRIP